VEGVIEKLKDAHAQMEERMDVLGLELFHRPRAGLFVWARLGVGTERVGEITTRALADGIWLAPGSYFRPDDATTEWFRFNAPYSTDDALWNFIEKWLR
jgi:DNA-binding transcriptional MocR family regulator